MSDKFAGLDLETLKASLEDKKEQLERESASPLARDLYRDLKALQYEISMRNARIGTLSESDSRRASA
ncbi:hypothetical protein [Flaviaesturariibacter amylovorans]|uniref:Uncharacterized protein n=1 Tax=Flaviaesturariibacter amylovorans TaxID=1084520 RepID=A0ABP8H8F1_9BACT